MMKREEIEKVIEKILIEEIIGNPRERIRLRDKIIKTFLGEGYRNVSELLEFLEGWNIEQGSEAYMALEPVDKGKVQMAKNILSLLEEING
jgi:hypothetical protein